MGRVSAVIPRDCRLRSARAFRHTYQEGTTVGEQLIVLHVLATTHQLADHPPERLVGFAVSKKVGNAVVRNRVRRRMRAITRDLLPHMLGGPAKGFQVVVGARPAAARATFQELRASMQRALSRAGMLAMTSPSPATTISAEAMDTAQPAPQPTPQPASESPDTPDFQEASPRPVQRGTHE